MTIRASIDIGTNSILLFIVEFGDEGMRPIFQAIAEPRLGRGLQKTGEISESSIRKAIHSIGSFYAIAEREGAEKIIVYGTEVFRKAENWRHCIDRIEAETGIKVRILSQREEAFYAFKGAVNDLPKSLSKTVMDLGGGSAEIVIGKENPEEFVSLPIGAAKLTEELDCIPPFDSEMAGLLKDKISNQLELPFEKRMSDSFLIGVGGTITTLGANYLGMVDYDENLVHGKTIYLDWLRETFEWLRKSTLLEIAKRLPFAIKRADIIAAGCAVYITFMEKYGFDEIRVSDLGSRWGILIDSEKSE